MTLLQMCVSLPPVCCGSPSMHKLPGLMLPITQPPSGRAARLATLMRTRFRKGQPTLSVFRQSRPTALYTCGVCVNLHKQGIFAQTAAHEERFDVVSRFLHGLENVERAELREHTQVTVITESTIMCSRVKWTHSQSLHGGQIEQRQVVQGLGERKSDHLHRGKKQKKKSFKMF